MYKILVHLGAVAPACDYYRSFLPFGKCYEELKTHGIELTLSAGIDANASHDCYIFHRMLPPQCLPFIHRFHKMGRKIVWDLDDNLFCIPEWSPANEMMYQGSFEHLHLCFEYSSHVTVTTDRLKAQFLDTDWYEKTHVLPNLIDENVWEYPSETRRGPVRIFWAGSITHAKDLDIIAPALDQLIDEHGDNIRLYFMGQRPKAFDPTPEKMSKHGKIIAQLGPVDLIYYPNALLTLSPDIAIAPLCDCPFNDAKSNIKYLEMTMAGAAVVASDIGPYTDSIDHCHNGFKCDESGFYNMIDTLIVNENTRSTLRRNAMNKIKNQYSWQSKSRQIWMDFFISLAR
jgi:O-antigen biosynthesis protein